MIFDELSDIAVIRKTVLDLKNQVHSLSNDVSELKMDKSPLSAISTSVISGETAVKLVSTNDNSYSYVASIDPQ